MNVLALDPGMTTGVAFRIGKCEPATEVLETIDAVFGLILENNWDIVIYERFITSGRVSSYGIATIELVGAIKALCKSRGITSIAHTPGMRKAFEFRARAILTKRGAKYMAHQLDALAHLLRWENDYESGRLPCKTT